ncbi:hypothetical protein E3N88_26558 [Mikania micrantha]|uniref:Uncharacterized protein n=1 Tax=Mikania micrantha TaxID=192012 RepID=A0A5N6MV71_9ASTR|nr:hypothetical protein E3N88_26558 [Mikania micrantha]
MVAPVFVWGKNGCSRTWYGVSMALLPYSYGVSMVAPVLGTSPLSSRESCRPVALISLRCPAPAASAVSTALNTKDVVLALDDSEMDLERVDNLIKFCSTKEDMEQIKPSLMLRDIKEIRKTWANVNWLSAVMSGFHWTMTQILLQVQLIYDFDDY